MDSELKQINHRQRYQKPIAKNKAIGDRLFDERVMSKLIAWFSFFNGRIYSFIEAIKRYFPLIFFLNSYEQDSAGWL